MEHSETLDEIAPALAKAQAEIKPAVKDSDNPFFESRYADLTSVWEACRDALHTNGLSVVQHPISRDGRIGVSTMLLHSSGQWIMDEITLGVKKPDDPQADGSSITYARRYSLAAMVGVCPEDDDAEAAMDRKGKQEKSRQKASDGPKRPDFVDRKSGSRARPPEQDKARLAQLGRELYAKGAEVDMERTDVDVMCRWYMKDAKAPHISIEEAQALLEDFDTQYALYVAYVDSIDGGEA